MNEEFQYIQDEYHKVKSWLSIVDPKEWPSIGACLEKKEMVPKLLELIQSRIVEADDILRTKLSTEINKLCILRQWCRFT